MSSEDIKKLTEGKGPYAFLFAFVGAVMALAQLKPEHIQTLRDVWPLVSSPAGLMLLSTPSIWSLKVILGGGFRAYLDEQRHRTKVEEGISSKLNALADHFERLFANHLDDRMYFDTQLTSFSDRLEGLDEGIKKIFWILEKRKDYIHKGDTEKFTARS